MANVTLEPVLDYITKLARKRTNRDANDADLLNRFVARRDENAFVGLLERYARLVWDVCRRVHDNVHDAEDSFQATFFVLARQAGKIRSSGTLASWLYRLAYRTAMHAKKKAYRRRLREKRVAVPAGQIVAGTSGLQELQAVLDSEVNRLAEKHRAPFVLCCLQGKSKSEAAAELGWKEGTVSSRLARARKVLQDRLTRRGITLSAVLTAGAVSGGPASAAMPTTLLSSTAQAALQFALGKTTGIADCASAATLANGVLKAMVWRKLKVLGAIILATTFLGTGTTVASYGAFGAKPPTLKPDTTQNADSQKPAEKKQPRVDLYGDPLPEGAIARLGTVRWRNDNWIGSLLISADNKQFVAGGTVWDRATGRILRRIEARPGEYGGFSADPERMVFYGNDYVVMREIRTQAEIWRQRYPGKGIFTVVSSPDGKWTAVVCGDSMVRILDAQTGKQLRQFDGFGGQSPWPPGAEFSPDGKIIATYNALSREALRLVDVTTGKLLHQLKFSSFAFSPDSKTLARVLFDSNQFEHNRARIDFLGWHGQGASEV